MQTESAEHNLDSRFIVTLHKDMIKITPINNLMNLKPTENFQIIEFYKSLKNEVIET
jgi:hypothetical protein